MQGGQHIDVMQMFAMARQENLAGVSESTLNQPRQLHPVMSQEVLQPQTAGPQNPPKKTSQKDKPSGDMMKGNGQKGAGSNDKKSGNDKKVGEIDSKHFAMPASMTAPAASALPIPSFAPAAPASSNGRRAPKQQVQILKNPTPHPSQPQKAQQQQAHAHRQQPKDVNKEASDVLKGMLRIH